MDVNYRSQLATPHEHDAEVVERKGLGHPDTLADGLAEAVSNEYSSYCREKFGAVLHHNVDKLSLIGGLTEVGFGEADPEVPARVVLNGRMSTRFGDEKIDIESMTRESVDRYLHDILPELDEATVPDMEFYTNDYSHDPHWYRPRGLEDVPDAEVPKANDTSTCVSYWPPSPVEEAVVGIESYFYTDDLSPKFEYVGQDIKTMAVRNGDEVEFTLAVPFISTETPNVKFYEREKAKFEETLERRTEEIMDGKYNSSVQINPPKKWGDNYYILATGSCIEGGEEGVVGRGNKARGTISVHRPSSMEAPHGKNPIYHVGKVYHVVADSLSREISEQFDCRCTVNMTSRFGADLYDPKDLTVHTDRNLDRDEVADLVTATVEDTDWTQLIIEDEVLSPREQIKKFKQRSDV